MILAKLNEIPDNKINLKEGHLTKPSSTSPHHLSFLSILGPKFYIKKNTMKITEMPLAQPQKPDSTFL